MSDRVREAAEAGAEVDFGGRRAVDHDGAFGPDRQVSAAVLLGILTGASGSRVHPRGVRIRGARIVDELDWDWQHLLFPLELVDCLIDHRFVLDHARIQGLTLLGCRLPGLSGDELKSASTLQLGGSVFQGPVFLRDAVVEGSLLASGTTIGRTPNSGAEPALYAPRLQVRGHMVLEDGFSTSGPVRLSGARIGGNLKCEGAAFHHADGDALDLADAEVAGSVILGPGLTTTGRTLLSRMRIAGHLDCDGATLVNPGGTAFEADQIELGASLYMRSGFDARGQVRLIGARIRGNWECSGGTFGNPGGFAIWANHIRVEGNIFLRQGFRADGCVRMLNARASGLDCQGGSFIGANGHALLAWNLRVSGDVSLGRWEEVPLGHRQAGASFTSQGEVSLAGARIGGSLGCRGAQLVHVGERALDLANTEIGGNISLNYGFTVDGFVVLAAARVGGDVNCAGGSFKGDFAAAGLTVNGSLRLRELGRAPTRVVLRRAQVRELDDDETGWPPTAGLFVDGFGYDRLSDRSPRTPQARLAWIRRQSEYAPEPYQQLAAVYRSSGQIAEATTVAIAQQDDLLARGDLSRPVRVWTWFLGRSIGYGYRPGRAAWALLMLYVLTFAAVDLGARANAFIQVGNTAPQATVTASHCSDSYPCLVPAAYTLENITPILNLHQAENWHPRSASTPERLLRDWLYLSTVLGYAGTTLLAAGLSGLARSA